MEHVRDNIYKVRYRRANGRAANRYYIKTACSSCGREMYQHRSNAAKDGAPVCGKECKRTLLKAKDGTTKVKTSGHVLAKASDHPACDRNGFVPLHRLIVEKSIGRLLTKDEVVHHIDGVVDNNKLSNLFVTDSAGHCKAHNSTNTLLASLLDSKIIYFDRQEGIYKLCQ